MSLDIPDTPNKAIEYTLAFLPGFVCLGAVVYIADIGLSDFAFTYLAVTLSILIYVLVGLVALATTKVLREYSSRAPRLGYRLLATCTVTALVAIGLILVYESQVLVSVIRAVAPSVVLKTSQRTPLVALIGADADRTLHKTDDRPVAFRLSTASDGLILPYSLYIRVKIADDVIYEGRPARFGTGRDSSGFPLILSPACRVTIAASSTNETFARVYGPGVYVTGHDLQAMELIEMKASGCWRCFFGKLAKEDPDCSDALGGRNKDEKETKK